MGPKFTLLEVTFLVLSIVGMALTWYFNGLFYLSAEDISITNFITLANATLPAKSITADISVVAVTFLIWMAYEGRRLELKYLWLLIPLTFLVAIAFTFPLFLFFRERKIRTDKYSSAQQG